MDKNTLSNYGWIVIAVLVLSVMIALATPFGKYIENGVRSTTTGLFDTSEKALNVVGMSAGDGSFEDGYQGVGSGELNEPETYLISFRGVLFDANDWIWDTSDETITTTYTLDEIKALNPHVNYALSNDSVGDYAFWMNCNIKGVIVPNGVTSIGRSAFGCTECLEFVTLPASITSIGQQAFQQSNITNINYGGTMAQWDAIEKYCGSDRGEPLDWNVGTSEITVICTDGVITVPAFPYIP